MTRPQNLGLGIVLILLSLTSSTWAAEAEDQPPRNVTVQVMMFHGSVDIIGELFPDPLGPARSFEVSEATLKKIREYEVKKKVNVVFRSQIATLSGYQAQVRVVTEEIYATEYDLQKTDFFDQSDEYKGRTVCVPFAFRTREVGSLLNVTPVISENGRTVSVTVIPEWSQLLGYKGHRVKRADQDWKVRGTDNNDDGATGNKSDGVDVAEDESETFMPVAVEMPEFASANLTTSVVVESGRPVILAVSSPSAQQKNVPSDHLIVMMLTATVAKVGGGN